MIYFSFLMSSTVLPQHMTSLHFLFFSFILFRCLQATLCLRAPWGQMCLSINHKNTERQETNRPCFLGSLEQKKKQSSGIHSFYIATGKTILHFCLYVVWVFILIIKLFIPGICHPEYPSESCAGLFLREASSPRNSAGLSQSSHTLFVPAHFASVIHPLLLSIGCEQFVPARVIFYFLLVCSRNPGELSWHSPGRAHKHQGRDLSTTSSS